MRIFYNIDELPKFKNAVLTIGSFDGVHIGHQKIIKKLVSTSKEIDGESVLITFHPHPRHELYPNDYKNDLLSSINEKIELLKAYGIDNLVIAPFTIEFSQQDPREYIENFLIKSFDPRYIIIGYDHKFGYNRTGDINLLKQYVKPGKLEIIEISALELENITISSTKIRKALVEGDIETSNSYLNHPYLISGKVVTGYKIGNTIGYPTANIKVHDQAKLVPCEGIYAVQVTIKEELYDGMLYIGRRPTLDDHGARTIEVNIFDFDDDIYNDIISIHFIKFLRKDKKFDGLDSLRNQLDEDKKNAVHAMRVYHQSKLDEAEIAIVILNYNGIEYLESYLPSVLYSSSKLNFIIYVIDNASTDDSIEYLEEWHPEVRLITLRENYGFAGGYNKGLEQINHKYYILLNSDIEVTPNWIDTLYHTMESDSSIASCQPKILDLKNREYFEHAGAAGGYIDYLGYPLCRGRILDKLEKDLGQYDDTKEIFWTTGAAMMIKSKIFHDFEGFDATYFAHMEEIDLCWRLKRAGYKTMAVGDSRIFHIGGGSLAYESPRKIYLNFKNNLETIIKNYSTAKLLYIVPIRLVLDGVAGLNFIFSGQIKLAMMIVKAHFYIYFHIFGLVGRRRKYNKIISDNQISKPNMTGLIKKSVIFNYFVKKKKTFNKFIN